MNSKNESDTQKVWEDCYVAFKTIDDIDQKMLIKEIFNRIDHIYDTDTKDKVKLLGNLKGLLEIKAMWAKYLPNPEHKKEFDTLTSDCYEKLMDLINRDDEDYETYVRIIHAFTKAMI